LPKSRAVGVELVTGGGTETGTEAVTVCVPSAYVAVIVAVPFATAVTIPLLSTVAMFAFEDVYASKEERVTCAVEPSGNLAEISRGARWPTDRKNMRDGAADMLVG
jgi:hypothetical protein